MPYCGQACILTRSLGALQFEPLEVPQNVGDNTGHLLLARTKLRRTIILHYKSEGKRSGPIGKGGEGSPGQAGR